MHRSYEIPSINMTNKEIVRYYSIINPWIDAVIIVNKNKKEETEKIVETAMKDFWKDYWKEVREYECYGDIIIAYLEEAKIEFDIILHDSSDKSEDYEELWDNYISFLKRRT